jgi:hypothetical protein
MLGTSSGKLKPFRFVRPRSMILGLLRYGTSARCYFRTFWTISPLIAAPSALKRATSGDARSGRAGAWPAPQDRDCQRSGAGENELSP